MLMFLGAMFTLAGVAIFFRLGWRLAMANRCEPVSASERVAALTLVAVAAGLVGSVCLVAAWLVS